MSTSPQTSEKPATKRPTARRSGKTAAASVLKDSVEAATRLGFPEPEVMELDAIVPYWRNPRRVNDDAVNALVASIREYGYSQPIVVDESRVIVIGHTRYTALRRMGVTSAPVITARNLSPLQVKELRVLDNRSGEFTSWDFETLSSELHGLNLSLMRAFFPEVGSIRDEGPGLDGEEAVPAEPDTSMWDEVDRLAEFICPECFHTFEITVTPQAVRTGKLQVQS